MNDKSTIYLNPSLNENCVVAANGILDYITELGYYSEYPIDSDVFKMEVSEIIKKSVCGNVNYSVTE
jgi:hypothetical protein